MLDAFPPMLVAFIAIVVGIGGLVWSADRFVGGAASIAEAMRVAPVIIGLTIVSFGTSAPEIMVSLIAAVEGNGDLAVGNALGSNIANIGLVLGLTLLISWIPVQLNALKHEGSILLAVTFLAGYFLMDSVIAVWEGWVLAITLIPAMTYLTIIKQRDYRKEELVVDSVPHYSPALAWTWFGVGLVTLIVSSKVLVWGAVTTAEHFGVSPLIIGLSIVAIGTSLPELAASVMSAIKGHHDIAVGNVIGSNIFNILAVMSIPGIVGPEFLEAAVFTRDFTAMLFLTLFILGGIYFAVRTQGDKAKLGRGVGTILLLAYLGYMIVIARSQFGA